jgi:hypothetical protein
MREQHNFRLHPDVDKWLRYRAKDLNCSMAAVIEMLCKEADGNRYLTHVMPGAPARKQSTASTVPAKASRRG